MAPGERNEIMIDLSDGTKITTLMADLLPADPEDISFWDGDNPQETCSGITGRPHAASIRKLCPTRSMISLILCGRMPLKIRNNFSGYGSPRWVSGKHGYVRD